jgi:medium-chain acyl-[acyl-carrier-protein] hydrolase
MTASSAGLIVRFQPTPAPRVRLLCFPHAGGGTAIYRPWISELPGNIEVCAVQPPGREGSFGAPPITSMRALVAAIVEAILPLSDLPIALFGHSLGAIVAYETALSLLREGIDPLALVVSSHRAPHLPSPRPPIAHLPDADFLDEVVRLGGIPPEVLASSELIELILPVLRTDFHLAESYHAPLEVALRAPVLALGSRSDYVSEEAIAAWRAVTCGSFSWRMFAGDHFYINTERRALTACVADLLERRLAACETGPSPSRS